MDFNFNNQVMKFIVFSISSKMFSVVMETTNGNVTHHGGTNMWEFSCGARFNQFAESWKPDDELSEHRFLRVKGG